MSFAKRFVLRLDSFEDRLLPSTAGLVDFRPSVEVLASPASEQNHNIDISHNSDANSYSQITIPDQVIESSIHNPIEPGTLQAIDVTSNLLDHSIDLRNALMAVPKMLEPAARVISTNSESNLPTINPFNGQAEYTGVNSPPETTDSPAQFETPPRLDPAAWLAFAPVAEAALLAAVKFAPDARQFLSGDPTPPNGVLSSTVLAQKVSSAPLTIPALASPLVFMVTSGYSVSPKIWSAEIADSISLFTAEPSANAQTDPLPVGALPFTEPIAVDVDLPGGIPLAGLLGIDTARFESGIAQLLSSVAEFGIEWPDDIAVPNDIAWLSTAVVLSGAAGYVVWANQTVRRPGRGLVGPSSGIALWGEV